MIMPHLSRPQQRTRPLDVTSAELKGPRKLFRIWSGVFDFEPDLGLKLSPPTPKIPDTIPTIRHRTTPNDCGPISSCFDDDPKPFNCEIAQPSDRGGVARARGNDGKPRRQRGPCKNLIESRPCPGGPGLLWPANGRRGAGRSPFGLNM